MADNRNGVQLVGTVTATTSGSIQPFQSNVPIKNLTIIVKPIEDNSPYQVDVRFFGNLEETHTYATASDEVIAMMTFPNLMFPANVGTNAISAHYDADRSDYGGLPILITIANLTANTTRVFEVYAIFEAFEAASFGVITQES
jgi:hypothetical protein